MRRPYVLTSRPDRNGRWNVPDEYPPENPTVALLRRIATLPHRQAEILRLFYGTDYGIRYSIREIAFIFHIAPKTVEKVIGESVPTRLPLNHEDDADGFGDECEATPLTTAISNDAADANKPEPVVDARALTVPFAVEWPIVSKRDDAAWVTSAESEFREKSFRLYFDGPYSSVKDTTLRFALALAASCRPPIRPHLIPRKKSHTVKNACEPTAESLGTPNAEEVDCD